MAVVCAGPKAILDVPATLEYLETRGVPVVAVGQAELPGFFAALGRHPGPGSVAADVAAAATSSTRTSDSGSGRRSSSASRCPRPTRSRDDIARDAVERAIGDAAEAGRRGPGR